MSETRASASRQRLDPAGLALLVLGLVFAAFAYRLVDEANANPLLIAPSVVAVTIGATHLTKRETPRQGWGGRGDVR